LVGQNPKAPQIMAAMQAHIAEHVAFGYRQKIEQQLGMPLPPEDEKLPPEMETALSGMMAQAAQQLLQQNQGMMAQQQAQQQAQDPMFQLQQQQFQLEQEKVAIMKQKAKVEAVSQAAKIGIEKERLTLQQKQADQKQEAETHRETMRMGLDVLKTDAQNEMQHKQAALQHMQNIRQSGKKEKPTK
jgi:hypothetical protein